MSLKGKIIPILLGANSLVAVAALAVVLLRPAPAQPAAPGHARRAEVATKEAGEAGEAAAGVKLTDLVVRLKNQDMDRYVRISFDVELAPGQDRAAVDPFLPRIRDAFISDLSDRTLEELQGAEALGQLKRALLERLGALMPGVKVQALYVTDFIVQ
ncbi:MAG TPA: flagellar basal body-associated FliL family protein [Myxococcales bacterium]|jgi:flagellar FliL protein|nr:flagellar basal body-associated FliL family protein [Myxococcales bacterium]